MKKISIVSKSPKNYPSSYSSESNEKGSEENPYEITEYWEISDRGEWKGGFVNGWGYVSMEYIKDGLYTKVTSYNVFIPGYSLFENIGIRKSLYLSVNTRREGASLYVNALYLQVDQVYTFNGNVVISVNGYNVASVPLVNNNSGIYPSHMKFIGEATIDLNLYQGNVKVEVCVYYQSGSSYLGFTNGSETKIVYDKYR
jgi:hypothetical protein